MVTPIVSETIYWQSCIEFVIHIGRFRPVQIRKTQIPLRVKNYV